MKKNFHFGIPLGKIELSFDSFEHLKNGEEFCFRMGFIFFFFFSKDTHVAQIIIGMGRMIMTIKNPFSRDSNKTRNFDKHFLSVEKNRLEIFDFWSSFELILIYA